MMAEHSMQIESLTQAFDYCDEHGYRLVETYVDDKTKTRKNKIKREKIWFVDIMIPRKYIENKDLFDLDAVEEYLEQEKDSENE